MIVLFKIDLPTPVLWSLRVITCFHAFSGAQLEIRGRVWSPSRGVAELGPGMVRCAMAVDVARGDDLEGRRDMASNK